MNMTLAHKSNARRSCGGWSMIESLIAVALMMILAVIALPQILSSRRMLRMSGVPREVTAHLRLARQRAMAERQAFTFQYNDTTKQISVIDHNSAGVAVLNDPAYPNNVGSKRVLVAQLTGGGVTAADIIYGIPPTVPAAANTLADNATLTPLVNNMLNVTFQPDGSVIDGQGNPVNRGIFLYNLRAPLDTAKAISVLGTAGRIKSWRYDTNAQRYLE